MGFVSALERRSLVEWLGGKGEEMVEGKMLPPIGSGGVEAVAEGAREGKRPAEGDAAAAAASEGAGADAKGTTTSTSTSAAPAVAPPAKKARFVPNKEDQDKVKRMMERIQGPVWGVDLSSGGGGEGGLSKAAAVDKVGGVTKNRVTALAGQRVNVSVLLAFARLRRPRCAPALTSPPPPPSPRILDRA